MIGNKILYVSYSKYETKMLHIIFKKLLIRKGKLSMENVNSNVKMVSNEEWYEITKTMVLGLYHSSKYYTVQRFFTAEDCVSEMYIKLLEKHYFEKYNGKTEIHAYVKVAVVRQFIDWTRKYIKRQHESVDKENDEGLTLLSRLADDANNQAYDYEFSSLLNSTINAVSDETDSKVVGYSPVLNREVTLSNRNILFHLSQGMTEDEVNQMYVNPKNGKPISKSTFRRYLKQAREEGQLLWGYVNR